MVPAVMIRDGKVIGGVYPDNSSSLGYVETVGSACQNPNGYTAGSYFVDGDSGLYFEATTAIASGATITVGTNCRQTTVAAELKQINSDLSELSTPVDITSDVQNGTYITSVSHKGIVRVGNVVHVSIVFSTNAIIPYNTSSPIFTGLPKCPNGWSVQDNTLTGFDYNTHIQYAFTVDQLGQLFPKSINNISQGSICIGATYICGD